MMRAMLAASSARVLVADGSKAGQRHLGLIGGLSEFGVLVSGGVGAQAFREPTERAGTRLVLVDA